MRAREVSASLMDDQIALALPAAEDLLSGQRAGPIAGEVEATGLVPNGDSDRVRRARLILVGHGHLQRRLAIGRDRQQGVRDVLDIRLTSEDSLVRARRRRGRWGG